MEDTQQQPEENSVSYPPLADMNLADVRLNDLVALMLLEEERAAEAGENIRSIKLELDNRIVYGEPFTLVESDVLGGRLDKPVTVVKKRFKPKRQYDELTVISKLTDDERKLLTTTEVRLNRDMFEKMLENNRAFADDFVGEISWTPEVERVEVQGKSAWLSSRRD